MNRNLKAWLTAVAVFIFAYGFVVMLQRDRAAYRKLVVLANRPYGPTSLLAAEAESVSRSTTDQDIKFVAGYWAAMALTLANQGINDMSEVAKGLSWDVLITGGLNTFAHPTRSMKAIFQAISLSFKEDEFKTTAQKIDRRYRGFNYTAFGFAAISGGVALLVLSRRKVLESHG